MIPLNICFSQNIKAKIQGLGQEVRIAFESIEKYIKTQDEKIEQLYKENAELKSKLEKSVELPCKVGDKVYTTKCEYIREVKVRTFFIGNPSYNRGEASQSVEMVRTTEFDIPFNNFGKTVFLTKEEAEQALKGGNENE